MNLSSDEKIVLLHWGCLWRPLFSFKSLHAFDWFTCGRRELQIESSVLLISKVNNFVTVNTLIMRTNSTSRNEQIQLRVCLVDRGRLIKCNYINYFYYCRKTYEGGKLFFVDLDAHQNEIVVQFFSSNSLLVVMNAPFFLKQTWKITKDQDQDIFTSHEKSLCRMLASNLFFIYIYIYIACMYIWDFGFEHKQLNLNLGQVH